MRYQFFVYILSSFSGVLYIGVTNNLERRILEHKEGLIKGFTKKYRCDSLVYYEDFTYIDKAIEREKQLKNWSRKKKLVLIESLNPKWRDLFEGFS